MTVVASTMIGKETAPTDRNQLWEPPALFEHNWQEPVQIENLYHTNISSARSVAEVRHALADKGVLSQTASLMPRSRDSLRIARGLMMRQGKARSLWPLYSEQVKITNIANFIFPVVSGDFVNHRYYVGGRVLLIPDEFADYHEAPNFIIRTINGVTDTSLTLSSGVIPADFLNGRIFPAIECDLSLDQMLGAVTDQVAVLSPVVDETAGKNTLDPTSTPGSNPTGFSTHQGLPVFDIDPNWVDQQQIKFSRVGKGKQLGIGTTFDVFGSRSRVPFELSFMGWDREQAWKLIRFFDSRAGSAHPFWIVSPTTEYTLLSIGFVGPDIIEVESAGTEYDWNWHPWIALVENDGTVHIREIQSVTRSSGKDQLTLTTTPPSITVNDVRRTCIAHKARFDMDSMTELWVTPNTMETTWRIMELINEKTVSVTVDDPCKGGSGDPWDNDEPDPCAGNLCQCPPDGACIVCLDEACTITLEWWYYTWTCPTGCLDQCDLLENGLVELSPVSCISGVARWEGPDNSFAELNTCTGEWSWGLPDGANSGFNELGICECLGDPNVITETCDCYLEEGYCPPLSGTLVPVIRIKGSTACLRTV